MDAYKTDLVWQRNFLELSTNRQRKNIQEAECWNLAFLHQI